MRFATLALLASVLTSPVLAADLDYGVLRGSDDDYLPPAPIVDWSGFYVGGHGGYSSAALGFGNAFQAIVANDLRYSIDEAEMNASQLLSARGVHATGSTYGVFAGINYQFDEVVVGLEADYTNFGRIGSTSDRIARFKLFSNGYFGTVDLSGQAATKIEDFGTVRGRIGYAFGNFLPFVTGGLAVGRAVVDNAVTVRSYGYDQAAFAANQANGTSNYVDRYGYAVFDPNNPARGVPLPRVYNTTKEVVTAGIAVGAGLEYAITSNFLLRGEYQYVLFNDFQGRKAELNTVRGGAAIKF